MSELTWSLWEPRFAAFVAEQLAAADQAHDLAHVTRVVATAKQLAAQENARLEIVLPAAWLHDCVVVAKNSPLRSQASQLAGEAAVGFLRSGGYPEQFHPDIRHVIEAHSYSANIPPRTLEARVVQDADRLDSLGAIGVARCLLTGAAFGTALYAVDDPWGEERPLNDKAYSIDHFFIKLFKLAEGMQTAAGKAEAERRTTFMRHYIAQLRREIG